jgi:hypothetical protein
MMVYRKHHNGLLSLFNFPAESRLKEDLSAITVYTQVFTVILKAERRDKKDTCIGRIISLNPHVFLSRMQANRWKENFVGERTTFHPTSRGMVLPIPFYLCPSA